jgi:hypothetical protein
LIRNPGIEAWMPGQARHDNLSALHRTLMRESSPSKDFRHMEPERINQIGGKLTDLAARTQALRGYL